MAISTICLWDTGMVLITVFGSTFTSSSSNSFFVASYILDSLVRGHHLEIFGNRPSHMLSITLRFKAWFSSWCTIATPFSRASFEVLKLTSLPSR